MKKFLSVLGASLFALGFVGCSNEMDNSKDLLLLQSGASKSEYGTIIIKNDTRALSTDELTSATVTVSGYGMEDISKSVTISGASGNVAVEKVPTGKNRVVKVESNVTGAVLYELVDQVTSGNNTIDTVDWSTTPLGAVFYNLIKAGVDVFSIDKSVFENVIPTDVHACLVDAATIALDYKNGGTDGLDSASSYKLSAGTVTATVYGYSGKTIQIADPSSSVQTAGADGTTVTFTDVLPGKWNVYADGNKVKTITVAGGNNEVTIGSSISGRVIIFANDSEKKTFYIWKNDTTTNYSEDWPGSAATAATDDMMNNPAGWSYVDITDKYDGGSINLILNNNGSNQTGDLKTGKTATFWYDAAGTCGTAGTFYDSDPTENQLSSDATLASISVNGTALSGFASGTISYTAAISAATTSASVTAIANDSAASVSVSPSGSASIASGESQVFTITVTAEDGSTKTYTVTVKRAAENDTTLASISVNGKTASISGTSASINITGSDDTLAITSIVATAADSNASVTYSATTGTIADGASKNFTITVKNGSKTATYTLTVSYTKKEPSVGQYGTNDKGYGVNKTISSWSDWTEDMQIARGAAYDDPRTWMGIQETAYDAYALYAAYDDTNLYLMVELTNLPDGRATFMNHNYAGSDNAWWDNRDCPIGFVINTGKGSTATAPLVGSASGKPIWDAINFTDSEGFDFLFYHSSKYGYADHKAAFVGVGTPGFFKLNSSTGYFSYDAAYCLSANSGAPGAETAGTSGISVRYNRQCQVSSTVNFESTPTDNRATSGQTGEDLMESETYTSVETNDLDMSYWYTIPLATLGIDKAYIQSNGIGVRQLTPNGGSLMDCLPWDPSMVDNATEPCSDDESTSHEKEDVDNITSAQARVGK